MATNKEQKDTVGSSPQASSCEQGDHSRRFQDELLSIFLEGEKDLWNFTENFKTTEFGVFLHAEQNSLELLKMVFKAVSLDKDKRGEFLSGDGRELLNAWNKRYHLVPVKGDKFGLFSTLMKVFFEMLAPTVTQVSQDLSFYCLCASSEQGPPTAVLCGLLVLFKGNNEADIKQAKEDIIHLITEGKQKQFLFMVEFMKTELYMFLKSRIAEGQLFALVTTLMMKSDDEIDTFLDSEGLELLNAVMIFNSTHKKSETKLAEEMIKQLIAEGKEKGILFLTEFTKTELYTFLNNEVGHSQLVPTLMTLLMKPAEEISEYLQSDGAVLLNAVVNFSKQKFDQAQAPVENEGKQEEVEMTSTADVEETSSQTVDSLQDQINTIEQFLVGTCKETFEGNFIAVKNFLKAQGGLSAVRDLGMKQTPLAMAVEKGDIQEVQRLIEGGTDPNAVHPDDEQVLTPLFMGVVANNEDLVRFLLEKGANVNHIDYCHATPLHYASLRGYKKIVEILIEYGANIHLKDCEMNTPAHMARDGLGRYLPAFMRPNPDNRREILDIFEDIIFQENLEIQDLQPMDGEFDDCQVEGEITERPWISHRRSPLYDEDIRLMSNTFQSLRSSNYFKDSPTLVK